MSKVDVIKKKMESIEYGFLDKDGFNIFDEENGEKRFSEIYYLMAPDELLRKKVGVCWDQVELERKLFEDNEINYDTYFIYVDDNFYLPSHTFLVYYDNNKVYWFEHSWYDEKGIHEYSNLNDLLNDVEEKFVKSRENELDSFCNVHIYKYNRPKFGMSCDEFYNYIFTQKEIYNFKINESCYDDIDRIKNYKLKTIFLYAVDLKEKEKNKIENYINKNVNEYIYDYKNIICHNIIVGSFLIRNIEGGLLIDEIFIEEKYRSKGIGSSIIIDYIKKCKKNLYLWVYKDNLLAIKLYKRLGFVVIDETENRYYMLTKC